MFPHRLRPHQCWLPEEDFLHLPEELDDPLDSLPGRSFPAERFDGQEAMIPDFFDDSLQSGQINQHGFLAVPDLFLDLPGTRVRHQLFDFFIDVVPTQTPNIKNHAEPL